MTRAGARRLRAAGSSPHTKVWLLRVARGRPSPVAGLTPAEPLGCVQFVVSPTASTKRRSNVRISRIQWLDLCGSAGGCSKRFVLTEPSPNTGAVRRRPHVLARTAARFDSGLQL